MCDPDFFNLKLKAGTMERISVRGGAATSNGKGERSLAVVPMIAFAVRAQSRSRGGQGPGAAQGTHWAGSVVIRIPQPALALCFLSLVSSFPSNSGLTILSNKFLFCLNQLGLFSVVAVYKPG